MWLIKNWQNHTRLILWAAIIVYSIVFGLASFWKYINFAYNSLDLAIINQMFFNSAAGDLFASSIHPPSYLGDHFTPILIMLLPIYHLFKHPLTLLFLQTIVIALCAWPIYLIAKKIIDKKWALFFGLAWLINPLTQNINLFEFHFLPLAIFFILWTIWFYQKQNLTWFLIFILLALLVREDVALVILMFSILAFFDKNPWAWKLLPAILAIIYGGLAGIITTTFSNGGQYKFLIYYSWINQPASILNHFATIGSLEFILGILLIFIFLPLIAPKYLILGVGIFSQLLLTADGLSATMLQLHYTSLLLPALVLASIEAIKKIKNNQTKISTLLKKNNRLALTLLSVTIIYSSLALGPILGVSQTLTQKGIIWPETTTKQKMLKKIPAQAAVATTYEFLAPLSSRKNIYSFNYAFLGKQQYLANVYQLPQDTEYLLIDFSDLITYQLQYGNNPFYKNQYQKATVGWQKQLNNFGLIEIEDTVALYQKNQSDTYFPVIKIAKDALPSTTIQNLKTISLDDKIIFVGFNQFTNNFQFFWQAKANLEKNYSLLIALEQNNQTKWQKIYPLTLGLSPTSQWQPEEIYQISHQFDFNKIPPGDYQLSLQIIDITGGGIEINQIRSTKNIIDAYQIVGQKIIIGPVVLE